MTKYQKTAWWFTLSGNVIFFLSLLVGIISHSSSIYTFASSSLILLVPLVPVILAHFAFRKQNRVIASILVFGYLVTNLMLLLAIVGAIFTYKPAIPITAFILGFGIILAVPALIDYILTRAIIDTFKYHKRHHQSSLNVCNINR